jgi:hypothetical protein
LFQAVQTFILLADDSDEVPKLSNGRQYSQFEISNAEWKRLGLIHEVLRVRLCSHCHPVDEDFHVTMGQEITETQHAFSSETEATVTRAVAMLEWLQTRWEQMAKHNRYRSLAPAIRAGLNNLGKWYKALDASDAYIVCHSTLSHLAVVASLHSLIDGCSSRSLPQTRVYEETLGRKVLQACRSHHRTSGMSFLVHVHA